ncbi:amidohydrolase family protein [Pseudonocardia sp. HH130630-07]|uniref:amidohydrolase family protein n=1 Tax=Pseudonocardia sp. HH130630-07 TaxID=1690815 RepID=UPI000814F6B1|nr:amidohydrolase family protein [Pseudonocardia sp. HH130630-07]ANY09006.1 D-glutamate deacylase [Pseudonocardia sp. HH130630-07]
MTEHDLVITGGRLVDPGSGVDAVLDVGITAGTVTEVGTGLTGRREIDARGLVVAPGFVDLHSHCEDIPGMRLQAFDGVTTALELEVGMYPAAAAYERAARAGRPINYGFATSWGAARLQVVGGVPATGRLADVFTAMTVPQWQRAAEPGLIDRVIGLVEDDLADGALGVGIPVGYAPGIDAQEYVRIAAAAAAAGRPTYTHARDLVEQDPGGVVDGAEEIVRAAGETGAHMHYCHVNSTSGRHLDRVHATVSRAVAAGSPVTTEAYPYGSGMTGIGAAFLAPDLLHRRGLTPSSIQHLASGRRMADAGELSRMRAEHGSEWAFVHFLDEADPADRELIRKAMVFGETAVASDGGEPFRPGGTVDPLAWPLPADAVGHPRTAGTYSRTLRTLVRESGALDLAEAVRRCSTVPAGIAARGVPAMERKGRLSVGADADVVVFDPGTVTDNATFADPVRPSSGFSHVVVAGTAVIRDGALVPDALPGRAVRAG